MTYNNSNRYKNRIITIPNILSFFRICLIPVIVWLYVYRKDFLFAAAVLILSGVTDIADGFIARKFGMISDFGKVFDPIADKMTQISVLLCLVTRFKDMIVPLLFLVIKEFLAAVTGLLTIRKTNKVMGADWHGKITTLLLYTMMTIHFVWYDIPLNASSIMIGVCTCMIILSSVLYTIRNIQVITGKTIG